MAEHDETESGPAEATGTGWAENESIAGSLSDRLAYLDSLAPIDEDGEFVVAFDEAQDEDPAFDEPVYADPYDDQYAATEPYDDAAYTEPYDDAAYPESLSTAYVDPEASAAYAVLPATSPVLPTSVPGLEPRAAGRRLRWLSLPVAALLLVTLGVGAATAFVWLDVQEKSQSESARRSGLDASRDAARQLFSYDYRTLDKNFSVGRALTTGGFRTDYDKTTTKVVADVAKRYKAVVKANVVNAGVVRASPDEVVTIVYVNQVTTSTQVTGEKVDLSRVRMTLVRSGGRWLVTKVDAL